MKWIGITGGIATGKSTVTKIIQDLGEVVVDADALAREVVAPGSFGVQALKQVFGPKIIVEGQREVLDREKLGKIIFDDAEKRRWLENTIHPLIQWRAQQERQALARQGMAVAFYDAALIYEKNLDVGFTGVLVVFCSEEIQLQRLMKRNGLKEQEALKRIQAQMPLSEKVRRAQWTIDNSGSVTETKEKVREFLSKILRKAPA